MIRPTSAYKPRPGWTLSSHAAERLARRFRLICDDAVVRKVSEELDSLRAKILDVRTGHVRVLEIELLGERVIAVCNDHYRRVVTFLKPGRWHRTHGGGSRKWKFVHENDDPEEE